MILHGCLQITVQQIDIGIVSRDKLAVSQVHRFSPFCLPSGDLYQQCDAFHSILRLAKGFDLTIHIMECSFSSTLFAAYELSFASSCFRASFSINRQ
jgi:hypothetical protein